MDKKHNNSPSDMQRLFNEHINILCTNKKIIIVDFEGFVARHGHENIYDDRLWYLARMKFDKEILELLAAMYRDYICAFLERNKKILVLDLDNTLYGGVIGEDGIDGIEIGNEGVGRIYYDFQRLIRILKERGVLLAICSKNNYSDVKEVFFNHPSMVLKEEDFIDMRINWNDKVGNLKEIANRLNLGLDSFVFLDDNPFERELIKSKLPQVTVPDFPADQANLCRWLIDISFRYFNKATITDEDKSRFDMYKSEFERKSLSKVATDLNDFYRSLKMEATITYNNNNYINRISQLTQRTNQFNLTTPRYSENQIAWFMNNKNNFVFSLELNDRFGSSGIVGVSILKIDANVAYIDTLLLSCRVVGRTVENTFIAYMLNFLRKKGIKYIVGE
jgi:FkbH-like protein